MQWLSRCLRRVQRRRRRRRARPRNAPCTRGGTGVGKGAVPSVLDRLRRPRRRDSVATRPRHRDGAVPSVLGRLAPSWGVRAGGNDGDARRPISVGRRESASVGVGRRNAVMSNAVDAAAPARCAGGAVVSRRVGGVLTGVLALLASSRATAAARAPARTRGTGGSREGRGSARLGRLARSWGRGRLCGCHPLAGIAVVHTPQRRSRRWLPSR